jgi:hypothetical protein
LSTGKSQDVTVDVPETKAAGVADGFLPNPKGRLRVLNNQVTKKQRPDRNWNRELRETREKGTADSESFRAFPSML